MKSKLFAIAATVGLVLVALGPGVATVAADTAGNDSLSVSVQQPDDSAPTVSVTQNGTGVADADVTVSVTEGTYDGAGDYTTGSDGTVSLPAPEENVSVAVDASADNLTASTTADLTAVNETELNETDSFGLSVSAFVHSLHENDTENIGGQVAAFAVGNNPGNAPDHAGPPAHVTGDNETAENETDRRGPPAGVGPNADENETDRRGPPADAGPNADDNETGGPSASGPPSDSDDDDETRGPPAGAGNGNGPGN